MLLVILIACIFMILSNILFFCIIFEQITYIGNKIDRELKSYNLTRSVGKMIIKEKLDTISKQIRSLQRK